MKRKDRALLKRLALNNLITSGDKVSILDCKVSVGDRPLDREVTYVDIRIAVGKHELYSIGNDIYKQS